MNTFTCPKGHSHGLQECFRTYIWMPVQTIADEQGPTRLGVAGEEWSKAINLSDPDRIDVEGTESTGRIWCASCGDTYADTEMVCASGPSVEVICQRSAAFFHISLEQLRSKNRKQQVAFCRQVTMYLLREHTELSFPKIGQVFGRDHSTAIHACNLVRRRAAKEPAFARTLARVLSEVPSAQAAA